MLSASLPRRRLSTIISSDLSKKHQYQHQQQLWFQQKRGEEEAPLHFLDGERGYSGGHGDQQVRD